MKRMTLGLIGAAIAAIAGIAIAGPVNVNTADAETIARELQGIGNARAAAIVEWRIKHGRFESVEDLKNVKGVGQKIILQNRQNIRFEDPKAESD